MILEDKYLATFAQTAEIVGDFYKAWKKVEICEAFSNHVREFNNTQ
jgi:hypothetical protein